MNKDEASEGKEIIKSVRITSKLLLFSIFFFAPTRYQLKIGFWVNLSVLLNPYFQLCFKFISTSARGFAKLSYIYIITLKPTLFRRLEISSQLSKPLLSYTWTWNYHPCKQFPKMQYQKSQEAQIQMKMEIKIVKFCLLSFTKIFREWKNKMQSLAFLYSLEIEIRYN